MNLKFTSIAFSLLAALIWFDIYFYFILPKGNGVHILNIVKSIFNLEAGGDLEKSLCLTFLCNSKLLHIGLLVIFDCILLYLVKKNSMPSIWTNSLLITGFASIGLMIMAIYDLPENAKNLITTNSFFTDTAIIVVIQSFFALAFLNKMIAYMPSFTKVRAVTANKTV